MHQILPIEVLLRDREFAQIDCSLSYPIAGAFTQYLIARYGIGKYLSFYQCTGNDFSTKVIEVYGRSLAALDEDFREYLDLSPNDAILEGRMEELIAGKL